MATLSPTTTAHGSERVTGPIRIRVEPRFLPERSEPSAHRYLFGYAVTISNEGEEKVRLRSRKWRIVDADGVPHEVEGLGVVGRQPVIAPGERFEYASYCPLQTEWGTMEGSYTFETEGGEPLEAEVARFFLVGPRGG